MCCSETMTPIQSIVSTPCECAAPGWCARHKCSKNRAHFELCRRLIAWYEAWELGEGPCFDAQGAFDSRDACRHRGAEPIDAVTCDLCGDRAMQVPVFACVVFGECTERRYGTRTPRARSMAACLSCERYEASSSEGGITNVQTRSTA